MSENNDGGCGGGCCLFNLLVGDWSIHYLLWVFQIKGISVIACMVIGLVVAEISVPAAIVVAILRAIGAL